MIATWAGFVARPSAPRERVQQYQTARLRAIVQHAALRVPYYRSRFAQAGLDPMAISSPADLARLPVTTKQDLQRLTLEERVAEGTQIHRCLKSTTSGSSGLPLTVLRSRTERFLLQALRVRSQVLAGLRLHDRRVLLRGNPDGKPRAHHRVGLFAQAEVDSCLDGREILTQLRTLAPAVIRGQPQTLLRVAEFIEGGEPAVRPRVIFSGADMLRPQMRRRIEAAFACRVVDFYGSDEFDLLAWECHDCGHYHTCDDSVIVEILVNDRAGDRPAELGEEGRVVVTGLHSFVMPFLRLDLGDLARRPAAPKPCRRGFGVIEQPLGRSRDFLPLPGGGALSPSRIELGLRDVEGLALYRVVQQTLDRVIVYYRPLPSAANLTALLEERCRKIFPAEMAFELAPLERIQALEMGNEKWRVIRALDRELKPPE